MNKKFTKFSALALGALVMSSTVVACGKQQIVSTGDKNKIQIYAYAVENGMGHQWLAGLAEQWNATQTEYEVLAMSGQTAVSTLSTQLAAGATQVNLYFGSQTDIAGMIEQGQLIDLTSVYESKVDGENGGTIKDKTFNYDIYKDAFSKLADNSGIYAVPYGIGMSGLVFDYKFFLDNDYLTYAKVSDKSAIEAQGGSVSVSGNKLVASSAFGNYKQDDFILTAGKDGKYGTYDDGQAITTEEYYAMLKKILDDGNYGYLYTTKSAFAYLPVINEAIMAQSMGYENYVNFTKLSGTIKGKDGTVQAEFTEETAKNAYTTEVVANAYTDAATFVRNNIGGLVGNINGTNYDASKIINPSSYKTTGFSHLDAQDLFVSEFSIDQGIKQTAFLVEGVWWEGMEAKGTLSGLSKYSTADDPRGYGQREYRYYLFPTTSTQVSATDKSVLACQDDGVGFILNNVSKKAQNAGKSEEFIEKCREFMAYTLSDTALEYYTKSTGNPRAFDYTLSPSVYNGLTPFQKNCWEITHDTEHVNVLFPGVLESMSGVRSIGGLSNWTTQNGNYSYCHSAFLGTSPMTVSDYVTSVLARVAEKYDGYYATYQESI